MEVSPGLDASPEEVSGDTDLKPGADCHRRQHHCAALRFGGECHGGPAREELVQALLDVTKEEEDECRKDEDQQCFADVQVCHVGHERCGSDT